MSKTLVVDDSKAIRMILGKILRELGHEVREAGDGAQALAVMETEGASVTLVLADWNMPVMNGFDLLKALRQKPEYSALPVVMVTTETEMTHISAALEAGATEYVMKPFTKEVVQEKLQLLGLAA